MLKKSEIHTWLNDKTESKFVFGLERMHTALDFFKPKNNACCIQILGTNGKGSTLEFLKDILKEHGKTVATYTSPHLFNLYDRFKVNDASILDHTFIEYLNTIHTAEKSNNIEKLSYFEVTTLLAYLYFSDQNTDYILIEAGLGGRLDATSAFQYSHLIFTSINYDHQEYLGNTLKLIAKEKLSVIDNQQTVFSMNQESPVLDVLKQIQKNVSFDLFIENKNFSIHKQGSEVSFQLTPFQTLNRVQLKMQGQHQFHNALLASKAAYELLKQDFSSDKAKLALSKTTKPGRYQKTNYSNTNFIFDVAHNHQSFESLMHTADQQDSDIDSYCVSMLKDKPWKIVLNELIKRNKPIYICKNDSARSWNCNEVLNWLDKKYPRHKARFCKDSNNALSTIINKHKKCLVFGSFFFVGPFLKHLQAKTKYP